MGHAAQRLERETTEYFVPLTYYTSTGASLSSDRMNPEDG